jgi:hypothetical protein
MRMFGPPEDPFHKIKRFFLELALFVIFTKELFDFIWGKFHQ